MHHPTTLSHLTILYHILPHHTYHPSTHPISPHHPSPHPITPHFTIIYLTTTPLTAIPFTTPVLFMRANIVGTVIVLSLLLWLPASCLVSFIVCIFVIPFFCLCIFYSYSNCFILNTLVKFKCISQSNLSQTPKGQEEGQEGTR